jgi:hypothetical protein
MIFFRYIGLASLALLRAICMMVICYAAVSLLGRALLAPSLVDNASDFLRILLFSWVPLAGLVALVLLVAAARLGGPMWTQIPRRRAAWVLLLGLLGLVLAWIYADPASCSRVLGVRFPIMSPSLGVPTHAPDLRSTECRRGVCGSYEFNGVGLRGKGFALEKPADTTRVLLIGDSYTFGSGVDEAETLMAHMARELKDKLPGQWQVVSAAFPGSNFSSYVKSIEHLAPLLKPDIVYLGFLKRNDLTQLDFWERIDRHGIGLFNVAAALAIQTDISMMQHAKAKQWGSRDSDRPPAAVEQWFDGLRDRLVQAQRRNGFQLIVYSYFGETSLFESAVAEGVLRLVTPRTDDWQHTPGLAIPGDGHPLGEMNRRVAQEVVAALAYIRR